jgi:uncharacterized protein YdaU (DUF1376 family)
LHYYQFNIGDYRKDTVHLSRLEHSIYRDLIDWYYLDEAPIPLEIQPVSRRLRLTSDEERAALEAVLNDFFEPTDEGWRHARIDEDIKNYQGKCETNRAIALQREARKRTKRAEDSTSRARDVTKREPNHKPITNNQEPSNTLQRPEGVDVTVWRDFVQHRKRQRADVTVTALCGIQREAKKAGWTLEQALRECVVRGWRGFKADWVEKQNTEGKLNAI